MTDAEKIAKLEAQLECVRIALKEHGITAKRIQGMNMSSAVATATLALNACLDTIDAVKLAVKDE
jgi:hypothetical protein